MNRKYSHSPKTPQPDWSLLRAFLAVVDAGSLTGAANQLATSQPTLSRQISELEELLGIALFERVARGLRLTAIGQSLVAPVREMEAAARATAMIALEHTEKISGSVRLTASEMTSAYILPPILLKLRKTHPQIQIELVVSNSIENLLERKADIAIRHVRPSQGALIAQHIGEARIGGFAHRDYISQVGGHIDLQHLEHYDWIGLDTSTEMLRGFAQAGFKIQRDFFCFRCDNLIVGWQAALAGLGIAFAPVYIAERFPDMRPVLFPNQLPTLPLWITAHRELRQSAVIRTAFDSITQGLKEISSSL